VSQNSPLEFENRLLAALPRDERDRFIAVAEFVRVPKNRILCESGETIRYAYFLTSGMVSLLAITEDGRTIEIGVVGNDGYVGVPLVHEVCEAPYRVMVQAPATAMKIESKALSVELDRGGPIRSMLLRYAHAHEIQLVQSVICNLYHSVEQRLSRRLLLTSNYLQTDTLALTQDYLGIVLDRNRTRISIAAGVLRGKGLIEYDRRGRITILDRKGLVLSACDCYPMVKG
jgi:CRP-like cAMP-binding protein